ncbi:MAG: hypothetical protein KA371_15340 [Acidobacteria bacterium]|nr:hypothetical protein [Acidobacteriota bacterium]
MNRRAFVYALALAAAPLAPALAHEGHDHKLLGTVTEVTAERLVVRATKDGQVSTIALVATTKITRGKLKLGAGDLKVGDRVVVNIGSGKAPLTAKAVQVGAAPATS